MAWRCSGASNAALVNNMVANGLVTTERVKGAMLRVDRAHYAPASPYTDSPQPLGFGATISAPHMHAHAAETLLPFLYPGACVLDVGSGSGYLTRVLAELVRGTAASSSSLSSSSSPLSSSGDGGTERMGKVVGVEHVSGLVEMGERNVRKEKGEEGGAALLRDGTIRFVKGDGRLGWKEDAPYDAIHVGAAAKSVHAELVEQLKRPGRLFVPVEDDGFGQHIYVVDKKADGSVEKKKLFGVMYVPLTDAPAGEK